MTTHHLCIHFAPEEISVISVRVLLAIIVFQSHLCLMVIRQVIRQLSILQVLASSATLIAVCYNNGNNVLPGVTITLTV